MDIGGEGYWAVARLNFFCARLQRRKLCGSCCRAVAGCLAGCLSHLCIVSKRLKTRP